MASSQVEEQQHAEAVNEDHQADGDGQGGSRGEKKSRRILQKLGLIQVDGIVKAEIRRKKNFPVVINRPVVLMTPGKNPAYFVLGQLKVEDIREELVKQYRMLAQQHAATAPVGDQQTAQTEEADAAKETAVVEEDDDDVDTTGLNAADINLTMTQTGKSKAVCVEALRKKNGDVIEAIMTLTS